MADGVVLGLTPTLFVMTANKQRACTHARTHAHEIQLRRRPQPRRRRHTSSSTHSQDTRAPCRPSNSGAPQTLLALTVKTFACQASPSVITGSVHLAERNKPP